MTAAQESGTATTAATMALSDSTDGESGDEDTEALLNQRCATASTSGSGTGDVNCCERGYGLLKASFSWVWDAGVVCCVVSSFAFSLNAVIVKYLHNVPVFQIAVARSGVSFVISYSLLVRSRGTYAVYSARSNLPWLFFRGFAGSSAMLCFYVGLQTTPIADAQAVMFLYPAVCAVLSFVFLGEKLGCMQVSGVLASMVGLLLVAHPPVLFGGHGEWGKGRAVSMGFLVAAAVAAATAITLVRKLSARESSLIMALWFHMTALAVSIPPLVAGWPKPFVMDLGALGWVALGGVALTSFTAQLLFNRGIQLMTGATAACIASLQVPLAHLWGLVIFHEKPTALGVAGTVLVIAGLVAVNQGKSEKASSDPEAANESPATSALRLLRSRSQQLLLRAGSFGTASSNKSSPDKPPGAVQGGSRQDNGGSGGTFINYPEGLMIPCDGSHPASAVEMVELAEPVVSAATEGAVVGSDALLDQYDDEEDGNFHGLIEEQ